MIVLFSEFSSRFIHLSLEFSKLDLHKEYYSSDDVITVKMVMDELHFPPRDQVVDLRMPNQMKRWL